MPAAQKPPREIYIPEAGGFVEVPVYDRYRLPDGATVPGPAIIEEAEATTVLWLGDHMTVDPQRNLVIQVDVGSAVPAALRAGARGAGR
jgi:N-methylhydantoinase A